MRVRKDMNSYELLQQSPTDVSEFIKSRASNPEDVDFLQEDIMAWYDKKDEKEANQIRKQLQDGKNDLPTLQKRKTDIYLKYAEAIKQDNIPLLYKTALLYAREKAIRLEIRDQENTIVYKTYPNRPGSDIVLTLNPPVYTTPYPQLVPWKVAASKTPSYELTGLSDIDFGGEVPAFSAEQEEKNREIQKESEKKEIKALMSDTSAIAFNVEKMNPDLYEKNYGPQPVGQMTKKQMQLAVTLYQSCIQYSPEGKPKDIYYEDIERVLKGQIDTWEYRPLRDLAAHLEKEIRALQKSQYQINNERKSKGEAVEEVKEQEIPIFFKTGPFSTKKVKWRYPSERVNSERPANTVCDGLEAVVALCAEERIHDVMTGYLEMKPFYPLHLFLSRYNPNIDASQEYRIFFKKDRNNIVACASAYHDAKLQTHNLPCDHWLALILKEEIARVMELKKDCLPENVKANIDLCIRLDSIECTLSSVIELNPFDRLTDNNRFHWDEINKVLSKTESMPAEKSEKKEEKCRVDISEVRVTEETINTLVFRLLHTNYYGADSQEKMAMEARLHEKIMGILQQRRGTVREEKQSSRGIVTPGRFFYSTATTNSSRNTSAASVSSSSSSPAFSSSTIPVTRGPSTTVSSSLWMSGDGVAETETEKSTSTVSVFNMNF